MHVRRGVDEAARHAPFGFRQFFAQIAFRFDGPEALAFDFRPAQIPTYVHKGGILVAKSMRIVRTPADVPARGRELARRRPDGAARRARLKRRRPADMRRRFIAF